MVVRIGVVPSTEVDEEVGDLIYEWRVSISRRNQILTIVGVVWGAVVKFPV